MNRLKIRWLALGLSALLCAGLAGCGQPAESPSASQPDPEPQTPAAPAVFEAYGCWFGTPDPLDPASVEHFADKVLTIQETYLSPDCPVYYAVIPDKTEFAPAGSPVLDSAPMLEILAERLDGRAVGIDLTGALTLTDYYKTDSHWRQEKLQPVLDRLGEAMHFKIDLSGWTAQSHAGFKGSYAKDIPAEEMPEEELVWLVSESTGTAEAQVEHFQGDCTSVYDLGRLDSGIPYDVYLSGATPLVTIYNPNSASAQELVIFRDSFGSSIAPLLTEEYRTITLVDLRYMVSGMLPEHVDFHGQDVLFLYSAAVVNRSALLR